MAIGDLHDEQEHGERIRTWLRKNGVGLLLGVFLGVAVIGGWHWRKVKQVDQLTFAAQQFAVFGKLLQAKELDKAAQALAKLDGAKARLYVELGALQLAKAQSEAGNTGEALRILRTLPVDSQFRLIADQRLARLLVATGKADEANKLLATHKDEVSFEIQGDALLVLGKPEQARERYAKALSMVDIAAPQRRILEIKLMDVGGLVPGPVDPI
ncbi:tetratricopeptide repeat protein [Xylella taiwanensis]|uniref:Ancillary SecYEG translocon subunit n=1 Tax=Xylella taiwanensis TaxID=1444770 RepID=Z9JMJ5_9GAMM|nr:YfgM family protein [Xylella taiwanensis]AXI84103.1 membrane protein [Xylella taiwanensis]EWS78982.1 membrane protein [Xylella taiwanensis]MCD8457219.1 YfgM family protein [Xylella taiwanensis]MCD8459629.1 YfgM family protein [Xylella taiwanensis]MCD8461504.1 YfgM family protein [Xylella taiwanensis]